MFDLQDIRKSMKVIGRAYQRRSVAMIELCRLFLEISPGNWDQVNALKSLVDIIDYAVECAVEAGKDRNEDADNAFAVAKEELGHYAKRYHPRQRPALGNVQDIIRAAAEKDDDIMKTQSLFRRSSRLDISPRHSSQVRTRFQILGSPTGRSDSQTLVLMLGTEVKITEVLWIFARLPPEELRIALKHAPHFYLSSDLPDRPLAYTEGFRLEPLKDLRPENDLLVLVLPDHPRTGRIFFECGTFYKTYTNIWKPHNIIILKDLQGTIEAASHIAPMIQGEVRIWKRGKTDSTIELTGWADVLDQALGHPGVDWLIRTKTSPEAIGIEDTWERCTLVPHNSFQSAAPLSSDPSEPPSPAQTMPTSPSDSIMASNAVHTQFRTRTKAVLRSERRVVTPVPPLASVGFSQSRDLPDVAGASYTGTTGLSGDLSTLWKPSRPSRGTDSPSFSLENSHVPVLTSRRSFESAHSQVSAAPLFLQTHSPLDRLTLSIEGIITGGTLTPDANETQTL